MINTIAVVVIIINIKKNKALLYPNRKDNNFWSHRGYGPFYIQGFGLIKGDTKGDARIKNGAKKL